MKLTYMSQMILAIAIVVVCYVLTFVFRNMLFRTIGLFLAGLLYTIHPVVPAGEENNKQIKTAVRCAGMFWIGIGLFT